MKNFYQTLGVTPDAEIIVIKAAYRALCKKYHPDIYEGEKKYATEKMQEINEAYEILSNSTKRNSFDKSWGQSNSYSSADQADKRYKSSNSIESEWSYAISYYPVLKELSNRLNKISPILDHSFKTLILEEKLYNNPEVVAYNIENSYLEKYFGKNNDIKIAAKKFILTNNRKAASELNKAVVFFGSQIDVRNILDKISKEYANMPWSEENTAKEENSNFTSKEKLFIFFVFILIFLIFWGST